MAATLTVPAMWLEEGVTEIMRLNDRGMQLLARGNLAETNELRFNSFLEGGGDLALGGLLTAGSVLGMRVGPSVPTSVAPVEFRVTNSVVDAQSAVGRVKLSNQLLAEEVSAGHAFDRHVLGEANGVNEFAEFGVNTRTDFAKFIEKIATNPTEVRGYSNGRNAILHEETGTVIIKNSTTGESTAFRPKFDVGWDRYIKQLPKQQIPFDIVW